eukprot:g120.t1
MNTSSSAQPHAVRRKKIFCVSSAKGSSINASDNVINALIAGWVSSAAGIFATHPLDTVRTRLQALPASRSVSKAKRKSPLFHSEALSGQLVKKRTSSLLSKRAASLGVPLMKPRFIPSTFLGVSKEIYRKCGGVKGFYRGVLPPMSFRGASFAIQRSAIGIANSTVDYFTFGKNTKISERWRGAAMGAFGGFVASITETPVLLLKTRGQTANGAKFQENFQTYWKLSRNIYTQEGGITALWRGLVPASLIGIPSWALMYIIYDEFRRGIPVPSALQSRFQKDRLEIATPLAGGLAAIISWPFFYPFDCLRTQMQCAKGKGKDVPGFSYYARRLFSQPVTKWFPGLGTTLIRAGPRYAITFTILDFMQKHPVV